MAVQGVDGMVSLASPRLQKLCWALFDWAQQPYFTLVGAFLFKPYFSSGFVGDPVKGQALIGLAGGLGAAGVALCSPLLGAALDGGARPKRWTVALSVLFIASCTGLWWAAPGRLDLLPLIMGCLIVAAITAELLITANNAMILQLTDRAGLGKLSGSGVALGFAGGLAALILYVVAFQVMHPPLFGLDAVARGTDRIVGPFAAAWYLVFLIPMLVWTPDRVTPSKKSRDTLGSFIGLLRARPGAARFLLGRMLIGDGLTAAGVFAGVLAAGLFGWGVPELATFALLILVLSGVGAYVAGRLDDRFGPKATVLVCTMALCVGVAGAGCVTADRLFFVIPITPPTPGDGFLASTGERIFMALGVLIGLAAGPMQTSLRTWMARLSPPEELGRWFGLFAFSNKATAFAAPLIIGGLTALMGEQRVTIPVVLVFLVAGVICLRRAPEMIAD